MMEFSIGRTRSRRLVLVFLVLLVAAAVAGASDNWIEHRLRSGETVYGLTRRYDVSAATILRYNDIADPTRLSEGTILRIPGVVEVQRGQTYYGLARRYGISVGELLAENDLSADSLLRVGDRLRIPGDFSNVPTAVTTPDVGSDSGSGSDAAFADSDETDDSDETVGSNQNVDSDGDPSVGSANGESPRVWPHDGARHERSGRVPGVSIAASPGDEVRAVSTGTVTYIGPYATFGRVVIVQSPGGYAYVYGGHAGVAVRVGQEVGPDTVLGTVAPAGDGAEVYFSVWRGDDPVDPERAPRR